MARRASDEAGVRRRIMGVARFSSAGLEAALQKQGIETVCCDLLDEVAVQRLPDAPNVLYLAGMKFGATGQEALTWAMNAHLPAIICRKYARSRIVAFSTGNVYGLAPAAGGGSRETDVPAPVGEYAMSCLGRERMFEHFSRAQGTRAALLRLNYACDLRYGVLVDLAQKVLAGVPVDLGMSWFNTIWQGDANAMTLCCLDQAAVPPLVLNLTGPELLNVRETCERLGKQLGRAPVFTGAESATALVSNAERAFGLFGRPWVDAGRLIEWVAAWVRQGGATLNKPTHFESRDGKF
jgi:nucleoside-diphosphate-sugar epimerase